MEGKVQVRKCLSPGHQRKNVHFWQDVSSGSNEHDNNGLHAYLLQVSTTSLKYNYILKSLVKQASQKINFSIVATNLMILFLCIEIN